MGSIGFKFVAIFILLTHISFSQSSNKKELYYFQGEELTEIQFRKMSSTKVFVKKVENDSLIINNIFPRKNIVKLSSTQLEQVHSLLSKIIGAEFDNQKKIMIHLYCTDEKVYNDASYKRYWNWVKKNSDRYQSYLLGTKNSGIQQAKSEKIYMDDYNLLWNLFFRESDYDLNHLLLKPDGEVYVYFGLEDILNVLDWSVE